MPYERGVRQELERKSDRFYIVQRSVKGAEVERQGYILYSPTSVHSMPLLPFHARHNSSYCDKWMASGRRKEFESAANSFQNIRDSYRRPPDC